MSSGSSKPVNPAIPSSTSTTTRRADATPDEAREMLNLKGRENVGF